MVRILTIVGFITATIGFILGAAFGEREAGMHVFLAGFCAATVGGIWGVCGHRGREAGIPRPIRLGAIGFGAAAAGGILDFYLGEYLGSWLFAAGFILATIMILIALWQYVNR